MRSLSPKELKAIAKIKGIKGYKSLSQERILSALEASESLKERKF